MHNKILGNCCNEKQHGRTASEKVPQKKGYRKKEEEVEVSLTWSGETGNGTLF